MQGKQPYIKYSYIKDIWYNSWCVFPMHTIIKISDFSSIPTIWSKEFAFEMYFNDAVPISTEAIAWHSKES